MPLRRPRVDAALLVVMQSGHRECAGRLELDRVHSDMVRLVTDCFERVRLAAPVLQDYAGTTVPYPEGFSFSVLYRRPHAPTLPGTLGRYLATLPRLWRETRRAEYVHVRLPAYPALVAGVLAVLLRKPIIAAVQGSSIKHLLAPQVWRSRSLPLRRLLAAVIRGATRWVVRKSLLCLVDGEHLYREELQSGRGTSGHVLFVGSHQFSRQDLRPRLDSCTGPDLTLLYVGRLSHEKGTDVLLDAFQALVRKDARYRLWLAGQPWKFDLHRELAARGLNSRVTLHGAVPFGEPLFNLYRGADILLFPSRHEGVAKVPMEALSQGLPVIVTQAATGGYIEHEVNGLVVPDADARALAAATERLVAEPPLRRRLLVRGLETARRNARELVAERIQGAVYRALESSRSESD